MSSRIMQAHQRVEMPERRSGGVAESFFSAFVTWQDRARQRRDLAALDDRMLRDIGVSSAEAQQEARKPFWRA